MYTVRIVFNNNREDEVHRHETYDDARARYLSYCWLFGLPNVKEVEFTSNTTLIARVSQEAGRTYFLGEQ